MGDARTLYNYLAEDYDLRQKNPATDILRKNECELIKKFSGGVVLDLGCGTGYHLDFYKNSIGLDISNRMLAKAKKKNSQLVQSSIEKIPFKNNSIDTIWCLYSTLNFCNLETAAEEISRVVKKSGKVIISVISVNDAAERVEKKLKIKKFRLQGKRVSMRLFDKEDIIDIFRKGGLKTTYFNSIFRLQKPRWGNFQPYSILEKIGSIEILQ